MISGPLSPLIELPLQLGWWWPVICLTVFTGGPFGVYGLMALWDRLEPRRRARAARRYWRRLGRMRLRELGVDAYANMRGLTPDQVRRGAL